MRTVFKIYGPCHVTAYRNKLKTLHHDDGRSKAQWIIDNEFLFSAHGSGSTGPGEPHRPRLSLCLSEHVNFCKESQIKRKKTEESASSASALQCQKCLQAQ